MKALLFLALTASAATLHVSPSGTNAAPCSAEALCEN